MAKIMNSSQVSIEFKPWTDNKFRITRLQIMEQLGGEVAKGEIDMFLGDVKESEKMITEQNTGTISIVDEKEEGISYPEINVYITEREFYGNTFTVKFVCVNDPEFFTKRITTTHQGGLKDIVSSIYPGPKDIRIESSITQDVVIYQNCETNYDLCRRLCYSYKDRSIFAFGWDGLLIKDMCGEFDHNKNKEPDQSLKLESDRLAQQTQTYNLKYNKLVNHQAFSPWNAEEDSTTQTDFSKFASKNCDVVMNYRGYRVVGIQTATMMDNAWNNTSLMETSGYTSLKIVQTDMPHYKLGDVVIYDRASQEKNIPWKNYLVTSNELFFSIDGNRKMDSDGFRFSWRTNLYGLEEGKWSQEPTS